MSDIKTSKRSIDEICSDFKNASRDALIPILQAVQESDGYLSKTSLNRIAAHLGLPLSKIYGVATFYNQFRFQPKGKFEIVVCRGTACHVGGSAAVLETLKSELKLNPGETTKDGLFSLDVVACIGACGLAPVISVNGTFHSSVSPDKVSQILNQYRTMEKNSDEHNQLV